MRNRISNMRQHLGSIVFLLICILAGDHASSQTLQPFRYEREQKNSDDYFHIISLEENGLALFRERDKFKNSNRIWELVLLDSVLRERKTLELEIKERYRMVGYEIAPDNLYFLFRTGETHKNDLVLIEVSLPLGTERKRHTIKPDMDFRLTHFIKAGENFVFGGYVSNEAVLVVFEPDNNSLKVVPGFFQKDTELVDLRTNQNQTFNAVLINRTSRGERKMIIRTFDETGKQLLEDDITIDDDISLITGLASSLEREDLIVAGTFGDRNAKQSQGFFTVPVNPFAEQKIRYVNFGELNNFLDYVKEKRAAKIKENTKAAVAEGRQPSFSAYVMPFRLEENRNGFYLLAEVYNPVNTTSVNPTHPYSPYSPFGYSPFWGYYHPGMSRMYRPYSYGPPNSRPATETKSIQTVVVALDEDGKVKWDQSLEIEDIRTPSLQQVSDFIISEGKVHLIYKKESELKVKTIVLDSGEIAHGSEKIKTLDEKDVIRSEKETEGGVRHWFGKSFYVWGYQTIRNSTKEEKVRDVFYINRVNAY